ncbi:MAG TPA: T9SS type A sorting domain-containing protein, partial [Bacteroidia bacterium]|nr:T9SS type A sorting domain-containing protein [Bacteroidia bacterium]
MKKSTSLIIVFALQTFFCLNSNASDYYWVNGTGNWNDYGNHWATTSGGLIFHTQNPTPNDNVFFDGNSFAATGDTVYVNVDPAFCKTMDWSTVQNNPVFWNIAGGDYLNIFGSLILSKNMAWNLGGNISFKATTTGHIFKTNNLELISFQSGSIQSTFRFDGVGGEWTILDTLHTSGNQNHIILDINYGSVICTHNFISGVSFFFATGNVDFDSTVIHCVAAFVGTLLTQGFATAEIHCQTHFDGGSNNIFDFISCELFTGDVSTVNHLRVYAPGPSINITGDNNHFKDAIIHGSIYGSGNYPTNYFGKLIVIEGGFSFGSNCEIDTLFLGCPGGTININPVDTVKINNLLTVSSSASNPVNINGGTILMDSGTVCFDNIYFQNTYAGGGATFYAGANSFNLGNTTGWIFSSCTPAISNVWPGDANYDLTCDNVDLLNIGIAFNETGPTRPGASLAWVAQPQVDWSSQFITMLNVKHADCDGNGVVNAADTLAVSQNYGLTHPFRLGGSNSSLSSGPSLYFDLTGINLSPGSSVSIPLNLGTSTLVGNGYGIAFTIHYDPAMVQAGSMYMDYTTSWLVSAPDYIHLEKDFSAAGYFDMGLCRTNHQSTYGYGTIAMLNFTVSNTASGLFTLSFEDVKSITDLGIDIPVSPQPVSVPTGINEITNTDAFTVYPNPATDFIYLPSGNNSMRQIEIFDRIGQKVLNIFSKNESEVNIGNLGNGIYFIKLSGD